ncbi:hypothetical protein U1701_08785 [Sphingomonas sp. PB2P19]|uniref:hypothetical protein n=1 Tax=Sphingomonas rhamnosi TaxID=3096156 RepID=UPI002FCA49A6
MRTLLSLVAIVILGVVVLMYFGIINIDQTQQGVVQAPKFQADVAKVTLGTENKTVAVPTISVEKPGAQTNAQAPN